VHAGVDLVLRENAVDKSFVADVSFIKRNPVRNRLAMAVNEVIENNDVLAAVSEIIDRDASNISGSAGD
jgi:hypothetical protein